MHLSPDPAVTLTAMRLGGPGSKRPRKGIADWNYDYLPMTFVPKLIGDELGGDGKAASCIDNLMCGRAGAPN